MYTYPIPLALLMLTARHRDGGWVRPEAVTAASADGEAHAALQLPRCARPAIQPLPGQHK